MEHLMNQYPGIPNGSLWSHHRKRTLYHVLCTVNMNGDQAGEFAPKVIYRDVQGRLWGRTPEVFLEKFNRV